MIKKNIANVNIGLLEKGVNKHIESFFFTLHVKKLNIIEVFLVVILLQYKK